MATNTFIIIMVAIAMFFSMPLIGGIMVFRHNPRMRMMVILGSAALEGLVLAGVLIYVFVFAGGLQ